MAKLISATYYDETREWVYVTDNFCRLVHDTRLGEWTLHRIPTPNDIAELASGVYDPRIENLAAYTAPIRIAPPTFADAPYHAAEVAADD
jgi:hypothetical protein